MGRLDDLDLSLKLSQEEEAERLEAAQKRLLALRLRSAGWSASASIGPPVCVLFEGWDASGKGGAIKRLVAPLDPRHVRVVQFAAPTYDEKRHHWLWRFWPALPGWGGMAVLDRSWYGRVLVERVEKFATQGAVGARLRRDQRLRAHARRRGDDPRQVLHAHLRARSSSSASRRASDDPLKSWKLTDEDWRNRKKRKQYKAAIEDMLERTDTEPGAAGTWSRATRSAGRA